MATKPNLPSGKGQKYSGEIAEKTTYAKPYEAVDKGIAHMESEKNDIGEKSGFAADTSSYIVKKGTQYGEAAKFNMMPPGMDISDQMNCDIRNMPLRKLTDISYPEDGWPGARDILE